MDRSSSSHGYSTVPAPESDVRLNPRLGTRHTVPTDPRFERELDVIEKQIRRGDFRSAVRQARAASESAEGAPAAYRVLLGQRQAQALIGLGDEHLAGQHPERARRQYEDALLVDTSDALTNRIAAIGRSAFDALVAERAELIESLVEMARASDYERWCEPRRKIDASTVLSHLGDVRIDLDLERILGPRKPVPWPPDGVLASATAREVEGVETTGSRAAALALPIPGFAFESATAGALSLEGSGFGGTDGAMRASMALPLIAVQFEAMARIWALDHGLDRLGRAPATTPLFRYEYLVEQVRAILDRASSLDQRMARMQFHLDDFAELIFTIRRHLDEESAELQAVFLLIADLQTTVSALAAGEEEIGKVVQELKQAEDDCDPEWWEILISVLVVIGATALGAVIGFFIGGIPGAVAGGLSSLILSIQLTIQVWKDREITCENVTQARQDFQSAHSDLKAALNDTKAELQHSLLRRDQLIASIASLEYAYDEASAANEARVLNAATLGKILGELEGVRRSMVNRAHTLARMAQSAFNAANDTSVTVVAPSLASYLNDDDKNYTASALLTRDIEGLEHIRLTSRTSKRVDLVQSVSLRKHYPTSFASVLVTGQTRFATRISDFDRWFPGTYMQRIREVQVEVVTEGAVSPIRGYLTNSGASWVRFRDQGNHVASDHTNVQADPNADIRKLCYKWRRRQHPVETMAFPVLGSVRSDARTVEQQRQERNLFENMGLETTWHLEITPDQDLELVKIRDIRVHFHLDALIDPNLKAVVEAQRYVDRKETALLSIRKFREDEGLDAAFDTTPLRVRVTPFHFEAPHVRKTIRDAGIFIRRAGEPLLGGVAKLSVDFNEQGAVVLETNDQGIVATSPNLPAGTGTADLAALCAGQDLPGIWDIEITDLPAGMDHEDIEDVFLLLRYEYDDAA